MKVEPVLVLAEFVVHAPLDGPHEVLRRVLVEDEELHLVGFQSDQEEGSLEAHRMPQLGARVELVYAGELSCVENRVEVLYQLLQVRGVYLISQLH